MIKGTLKSIVAFFAVLVGGVVIFRREEVWKLFVVFYTQWSPELIGTVSLAGVVLGGAIIFYICKQKMEKYADELKRLKEKEEYRQRRERNQQKNREQSSGNNQ